MLLVGGFSRRMGRDKATLVIEGLPLWEKQVSTLRMLNPKAIYISTRTAPAWCPPDAQPLLDTPPSCGPLSGLAAGLGAINTTHLVVLAVDMPHMTGQHLKKMADLVKPGIGIVPSNGERFEPLAAIYPKPALASAKAALASADFSMQSLVRQLIQIGLMREHLLENSERALYRNLNSPDELP